MKYTYEINFTRFFYQTFLIKFLQLKKILIFINPVKIVAGIYTFHSTYTVGFFLLLLFMNHADNRFCCLPVFEWKCSLIH